MFQVIIIDDILMESNDLFPIDLRLNEKSGSV